VYFLQLYGDPGEMHVHIGHLCLETRNEKVCQRYYEDMLRVEDYNALVKFGKEQYPNDFNSGGQMESLFGGK